MNVDVAGLSSAASLLNAIRASPMSRSRFFGSRSRQRSISRRTTGGVLPGSKSSSGPRVMIAASVSVIVSPPNALRPVSIS